MTGGGRGELAQGHAPSQSHSAVLPSSWEEKIEWVELADLFFSFLIYSWLSDVLTEDALLCGLAAKSMTES